MARTQRGWGKIVRNKAREADKDLIGPRERSKNFILSIMRREKGSDTHFKQEIGSPGKRLFQHIKREMMTVWHQVVGVERGRRS